VTGDAPAILLDTDVYSRLYIRARRVKDPTLDGLAGRLVGARVVIAFQTRAEALSGALQASWGDRRVAPLRAQLDATATIGVDDEVIDAFAQLTADCRGRGHALQDKKHTGDRWIAACAVAKGVPLLTLDGIFRGVPGLELFDA